MLLVLSLHQTYLEVQLTNYLITIIATEMGEEK